MAIVGLFDLLAWEESVKCYDIEGTGHGGIIYLRLVDEVGRSHYVDLGWCGCLGKERV